MSKRGERGHYYGGLRSAVIRGTIIGSLVGLAVLPPIANKDVVVLASGLDRDTPSCADGVNPSNTEGYPYDAIAVLGAGMTSDVNGNVFPGKFETRRLYAAAILWLTHTAPHIVLLDGYLGPDVDPNINKIKLQEIVRHLSGYTVEIPLSAIEVESESLNTTENARQMKLIAEQNNWKKIAVDTDQFHIMRAVLNFCINNMSVTGFPVEDVVTQWAPHIEDQINSVNRFSPGYVKRQMKELEGLLDLIYTRGQGSVIRKHLIQEDKSDDVDATDQSTPKKHPQPDAISGVIFPRKKMDIYHQRVKPQLYKF
ncbi:MAG: YdcF family protein [Microgenomates group bacterium]